MTPARLNLLVALAVFAGVAFVAGAAFTVAAVERWSSRWHWAAAVLFSAAAAAVAAVVVIGKAPLIALVVVGNFAVFAAGNVWMASTGRWVDR